MPSPTACQTTFSAFRKNGFYFLACLFLNEIFLLIGSQILKHKNITYEDFSTQEAMIRVGWLSGAGNFVLNAMGRMICCFAQRNEEPDNATSNHPAELTLSKAECLCYTLLHSTGFPLFGAGASHLMKFNKPLRAAVAIAVGMAVTFGALACLLSALTVMCFGWECCERRAETVRSP